MSFQETLKEILEFALQNGADAIEVMGDVSEDLKASCRLGKKDILESSFSREIGIRLIQNKRQIFISSSDLSLESLKTRVLDALSCLPYFPEDSHTGLIEEGFLKTKIQDETYADTNHLTLNQLMDRALETESFALKTAGITNSENSAASFSKFERFIVSSNGFEGSYKKTYFSSYLSLIAGEMENMKTDYDYDYGLFLSNLRSTKDIGERAARRTLGKLNAKHISTNTMPVILDQRIAGDLFQSFLGGINGQSIVRKTSFLKEDMNKTLFPKSITIKDKSRLENGRNSRPFDDEGVVAGDLILVENGVLKSWILDHTSAKKLGLKTTGHAKRSLSSPSTPSYSNIVFEGTTHSKSQVIEDIDFGFYITDLMGDGGDIVSGNFSSGANGFLIERGKITTPIHEATVAGNLKDMFKDLVLCDDFEGKGGLDAPSLFIPKLAVGGQ